MAIISKRRIPVKHSLKVGISIFIVGILLIGIGSVLAISQKNYKKSLPKKQEKVPIVDHKNVDNNADKIKMDHITNDIVLSDVKIIQRDEIEAIIGYISNRGTQALTNVIVDISIVNSQQEVLETVSIFFETLPADQQKYYIESNMQKKGLIEADDYKLVIRPNNTQ